MVKSISRTALIGSWIATIPTIMAAASVVSGAAITISVGPLWLLVGAIPALVMLIVRGGRFAAVAELASAAQQRFLPNAADGESDTRARPNRCAYD
jgi:hypothetical protein